MAQELSWFQYLYGICLVALDLFLQKFLCRRLPERLPLQLSPQLTVVVTGATSGIGVVISRELARAGAHVVLAVRNTAAGQELVHKWVTDQKIEGGPSINAEVMELNLLSLVAVRAFAKQWSDRQLPLHVLINNAGIFSIGVKQKFSEDEFEHHMQVNHLGPALLSMLLLPSLIRGAPSRIVNVNSIMNTVGFLDPDDMNLTKRKFSPTAGYCGSKLAQVLFSHILQMRIPKEAAVDVILNHPGEVDTNVNRTLPAIIRSAQKIVLKAFSLSPHEGARSVLFCATDQKVSQYARDLREQRFPSPPYFVSSCRPGKVSSLVDDLKNAEKVYSKTLEVVGLPEDYLGRALGNKKVSDPMDDVQDTTKMR